MINLKTPVKDLGGSYKLYASRLAKLGILTIEDFLFHIPTRYEDLSQISPIAEAHPNELTTVHGEVTKIKNIFTKRFKKIQEATVTDSTGSLDILWFNQPFLLKTIHVGDRIALSGRVEVEGKKIQMISPDYEILYGDKPAIHTGRLVSIYPETKGITSKWMRRQLFKIIFELGLNFDEYIPELITKNLHLMQIRDAIEEIHFPASLELAQKARERLGFDELFLLQLAAKQKRGEWERTPSTFTVSLDKFHQQIDRFWDSLPFEPTDAQRKVIHEILSDLERTRPMNRLLQGDVGSGKTVVATIAMYAAFLNGHQAIFMAPTEILAQQHFETVSTLLTPFGVKVDLRTGNKSRIKKNEKENNHDSKFMIHDSNIFVGTHALLSDTVSFKNVGLVVIDEQQRFGVSQRAILKQKSGNPHLLTMTATPIPRTIALTIYGNLDLSVIDEMPKKRKPVKTWLVPNEKRESGYTWIAKQIQEHKTQAFIVCPFIEESETMTTIKAATKEFERLRKEVFPQLKLGLLHGKMKSREKEHVLSQFRDRAIDILVATPVVEVGIDFPNATIIVIEGAERFGLAGLHQLRGRVGRGEKQSYCLLFSESSNEQTRGRLSSLETLHNGQALAELDFKLRGPGDLYGTEQSGYRLLKIASFSDMVQIEKAKNAAERIFPDLDTYPKLREKIKEIASEKISPD